MAFDFSEGLTPVRTENQWGYIDKTGKVVIAPRFVGAGRFRNGIARVATDGWNFGRDVVCSQECSGMTAIAWPWPWGYIDRSGKFVIPPQFDQALDFWEGKAVVTKYSKFGLKDARGK